MTYKHFYFMLVICIYKTISESIKYIDRDTIPLSKNLSFSVKCLKMYPASCAKILIDSVVFTTCTSESSTLI